MKSLNEEIEKIKKLMLFESSETEKTEIDTEESEDVVGSKGDDEGDKNFMSYGDTTIKVSAGWLKDNKGRTGCVKVDRGWFFGGPFAQGIKKIVQKVKGNVVAEPEKAISLYDEIKLSKTEKDSLIKKWEKGEDYVKNEGGVDIIIGRTKGLTNFCKNDWSK
jgi:hypothetical protein